MHSTNASAAAQCAAAKLARMSTIENSTLGKATSYSGGYDRNLLFPIARAGNRTQIGVCEPLPFHGVDVWNAYELSWLDQRGKPHVALAEFRIPASSPNLVESKSFKLYLNGFAQEQLADAAALQTILVRDLSAVAGCAIEATLRNTDAGRHALADLSGVSLDDQDLTIDCYGPPHADFLRTHVDAPAISETLVSHLLRSNCPVTGQPDWGSVQIAYRGASIDHAGLLRYLVSFRNHNEFHEQCVERIFVDLMARCAPQQLSVYARYTRRGGLDINPWRGTHAASPPNPRGARQ